MKRNQKKIKIKIKKRYLQKLKLQMAMIKNELNYNESKKAKY
jgi:hypothetical protein